MATWHWPDTQCPVVALRVQLGEGWSDLGKNELIGGCIVGGSSAAIHVFYFFWSKNVTYSLRSISHSRAVVPKASRTRRRLTVRESELETPTPDRIEVTMR